MNYVGSAHTLKKKAQHSHKMDLNTISQLEVIFIRGQDLENPPDNLSDVKNSKNQEKTEIYLT